MTASEIMNLNATKTYKIQQLLQLGFTRKETAVMMGVGYGFVQNVYAAMNAGRVAVPASPVYSRIAFNKKFGVEFEAYHVDQFVLRRELVAAGIQCEIDGYHHDTRTYWKIVSDSSIDGNGAFELVSPVLQGSAGLEEVKKVCAVLKRLHAYVNKSCGTHVHFDAASFSLQHWKNLYLNYAGYESLIDSFMPVSRRNSNNSYCRSLNGIQHLTAKINGAANIEQIAAIFNNSRYYKINPNSYSRHKTVEFRQHSGTIEFEKISNWILFLHNLTEYSRNQKVRDASFESFKALNQEELVTYYHNRIQDLAA